MRVHIVRFLSAAARFFFIGIPVWLWDNIVVASVQHVYRWFTGQVRRYSLFILGGSIVLLLIATEQYRLLEVIITFSLTIFFILLGFRIMLGGGRRRR